MTTVTVQAPVLHSWTRADYDKMIDAGIFQPSDRIELIDGDIVDMTPQSVRHVTAAQLVEEALRESYPHGYVVRAQKPIALGDGSEPEPDIAVVRGEPRDYVEAHPETAELLVEVADSSLKLDRGRKRCLYARLRAPEYWILNLVRDCLEAYREPAGEDYEDEGVLQRGNTISPLSCPGASIAVADLLP